MGRLPTTVRLMYGVNLADSNDSEASSENEDESLSVTLRYCRPASAHADIADVSAYTVLHVATI